VKLTVTCKVCKGCNGVVPAHPTRLKALEPLMDKAWIWTTPAPVFVNVMAAWPLLLTAKIPKFKEVGAAVTR